MIKKSDNFNELFVNVGLILNILEFMDIGNVLEHLQQISINIVIQT